MNTRAAKPLLLVLLAVAVLVFPLAVSSNYWLNLVNLSISFSIACLGLNIVLGYAGQLSLAQAAFWAWGPTPPPSSPRGSAGRSGRAC